MLEHPIWGVFYFKILFLCVNIQCMLKIYRFFICWTICFCCLPDLCAETLLFDIGGTNKTLSNDTIIADGVNVKPNLLTITNSIVITNNGNLVPDTVNVYDGCDVYVENYGVVNTVFNLGNDAHLFQIISDKDGMKTAYFGADYTMIVKSNDVLSLADVVDLTDTASNIVFENITLSLDKVPNNTNGKITFGENVKLIITDNPDIRNKVLLNNISGNAFVRFINNESDVLFSDVGYLVNGVLYVERARQTDYTLIFKDDNTGIFLNQLRNSSGHNNFLYLLDNANNLTEITNLMNRSVLFNIDKLITPLQIVNTQGFTDNVLETDFSVGASVYGMKSDDFYVYGADINLVDLVGYGIGFNVGLNVGQITYSSDIDKYNSVFYGLDLGIKYTFDNDLFVHSKMRYGMADFDISAILYDNNIIENPTAYFGLVTLDVGRKFNIGDSLYLSSVVGMKSQFYKMENFSLSEHAVRIGIGTGYNYELSGMKYNYDIYAFADTDSAFTVMGKIGFTSPLDRIGANIGLSVTNMLDIVTYKAEFDISITF